MLQPSKPLEEWISIVSIAINKLKLSSQSPSLKAIAPYLPLLPSDLDKAQFYTLNRETIENAATEFNVPSPLHTVLSAYYISFSRANIIKVDSMNISRNLVERIGRKLFLGVFTACKIIGHDINGEEVEVKGVIFDPGWSIPVRVNDALSHEVLITVGLNNYALFYHYESQSLVVVSL